MRSVKQGALLELDLSTPTTIGINTQDSRGGMDGDTNK